MDDRVLVALAKCLTALKIADQTGGAGAVFLPERQIRTYMASASPDRAAQLGAISALREAWFRTGRDTDRALIIDYIEKVERDLRYEADCSNE
jgi:hypothetical protein